MLIHFELSLEYCYECLADAKNSAANGSKSNKGLHGGVVAFVAERVSKAYARTVVPEDRELFLRELSTSYLSAAPLDVRDLYGSTHRQKLLLWLPWTVGLKGIQRLRFIPANISNSTPTHGFLPSAPNLRPSPFSLLTQSSSPPPNSTPQSSSRRRPPCCHAAAHLAVTPTPTLLCRRQPLRYCSRPFTSPPPLER
ncbi:hypothetical protein Droror1_Dr00018360 [Drosera rotundifolia]